VSVADELVFDWDEANVAHVARHNITPEDVEEVFANSDGSQRGSRGWRATVYRSGSYESASCPGSGVDDAERRKPADNSLRCERAAGKALPGGKGIVIMAQKAERMVVPKFKTEAEEARWWYDNREKVEDALIHAMDNGTVRRGTARRLTSEARASRNVTIRMVEADLDLARRQAEEKGLPYQTYIKSVLHEALVKRERRKAS
jgi:predicted DNA binding CopG/RHH family protein